jgi:hypothetical protein
MKRGNVLTQSWRSKSAVFRMYSSLTSHGSSKIYNAVGRQRNLGLPCQLWWDELYIRKTADLPLRLLVGTFPRLSFFYSFITILPSESGVTLHYSTILP